MADEHEVKDMNVNTSERERDPIQDEMDAMKTVYAALRGLDAQVQRSVIRWLVDRLSLDIGGRSNPTHSGQAGAGEGSVAPDAGEAPSPEAEGVGSSDQEIQGVSAVALKWVRRNGFTLDALSSLFSLGLDEIDLVATTVAGSTKKERLRNVILLKALASYLGTGIPRVTNEAIREAATHYGVYDPTNFATYMKSFSRDLGGTKEAGYSLTAAGLAAASQLVARAVSNPEKG